MAGDARDRHRRVDGWFSEEVQAQLGILAIPAEQRAVDRVGCARPCLCANLPTALSCLSEYPGSDKEYG